VRDTELILVRKDGSTFIGELNASLITNDLGEPNGLIASTKDISERKAAEINLKESQKKKYNAGQVAEIIKPKEIL